jgi:hypothetical protein
MIEILIASPYYKEKLVAELWIDNQQIAEINQEQEVLMVEVHSSLDGKPWTVSYDDLLSALKRAKNRLVGGVPM